MLGELPAPNGPDMPAEPFTTGEFQGPWKFETEAAIIRASPLSLAILNSDAKHVLHQQGGVEPAAAYVLKIAAQLTSPSHGPPGASPSGGQTISRTQPSFLSALLGPSLEPLALNKARQGGYWKGTVCMELPRDELTSTPSLSHASAGFEVPDGNEVHHNKTEVKRVGQAGGCHPPCSDTRLQGAQWNPKHGAAAVLPQCPEPPAQPLTQASFRDESAHSRTVPHKSPFSNGGVPEPQSLSTPDPGALADVPACHSLLSCSFFDLKGSQQEKEDAQPRKSEDPTRSLQIETKSFRRCKSVQNLPPARSTLFKSNEALDCMAASGSESRLLALLSTISQADATRLEKSLHMVSSLKTSHEPYSFPTSALSVQEPGVSLTGAEHSCSQQPSVKPDIPVSLKGTPRCTIQCSFDVSVSLLQPAEGHRSPLLVVISNSTEHLLIRSTLSMLAESQLELVSSTLPSHAVQFLAKESAEAVPHNIGQLARKHRGATLLFVDIVGFTTFSKRVEPEQVMELLNALFSLFDKLVDKYGVHKVETAGDCYIVSGGIMAPRSDKTLGLIVEEDQDPKESAQRVLNFAKELLKVASQVIRPDTCQPVSVRIGLHSGDVVSGLIGSKLPKFSVFGDAMNTASRMESTGFPGRIHVSETTRALLPHEQWEPTGGVEVKGKGQMQTFLWVPPSPWPSRLPSPVLPSTISDPLASLIVRRTCALLQLMQPRTSCPLPPAVSPAKLHHYARGSAPRTL